MLFQHKNDFKYEKKSRRKRYILGIGSLLILGVFLILSKRSNSAENCYMEKKFPEDLEPFKLEDIILSKQKPKPGKSIFFHETSCSKTSEMKLTVREACAIESAALKNPNTDVFVLFTSSRILSNSSIHRTAEVEAILSYPNVHLRNLNLWTYAAGTPIYDWLKDGKLFESQYLVSHTSDFLRYLTLWKWGGTYLDLDVIVKENLERLPPNFAGAESDVAIAAGVLNFDHDGFGHEIAESCLLNFQRNFNGNDWGTNGPGVITRVLHEICKTKYAPLMSRERCLGFKVFPPEAFYAIRWKNWNYFFMPQFLNITLKKTNHSIILHVWNKHSASKVLNTIPNVAYAFFAQEYCPKVYKVAKIL